MSKRGNRGPTETPAPDPNAAQVDPVATSTAAPSESEAAVAPAQSEPATEEPPVADTTAVSPPFVEPFEPPLGIPPASEADRESASATPEVEPEVYATKEHERGKPLPEGAVWVEAINGVIERVQHRYPGECFWMMREAAEERAQRGDVKIL